MIREGFSLNPLVWLYVWTGSGDDVEKVRLPDPVSMRRYVLADKEKPEAMLIDLVLKKVYFEDGEVHVAESYQNSDVIPVLCHFIMARRPRLWTRVRRALRLSDHSARTMRRLLVKSRLDIRSALDAICRLCIGPTFKEFEKGVLEKALLDKGKKPRPRKDEIEEANYYYGLLVNFGIKPWDARAMTAYEITMICESASIQSKKQGGVKGYDQIQREMGRAPRS